MKTFTFFVTFLVFTALVNAQDRQNLSQKIQQTMQGLELLNQQSSIFTGYLYNQNILKSTVAVKTLDSTVTQMYIDDPETWRKLSKEEYYYNSESLNTSRLYFDWTSGFENWSLFNKVEVKYDNKGRLNLWLLYNNYGENPELILDSKIEAKYNAEGRIDTVLHYVKESEPVWNLLSEHIYNYNEVGQVEQLIISIQGYNNTKVNYTYRTNGKLETTKSYDIVEGNEILYSQYDYSYNESGQLVNFEISILNTDSMILEKSDQRVYEYNDNGDIDLEIYSEWNNTEETWSEQVKYEYLYSDESFSEVVLPTYIDLSYGMNFKPEFQFNKLITGFNTYLMVNGNWRLIEKTNYYYSGGISTGTDDVKNIEVSVFPNPVSESVTFRWRNDYNYLTLEMYRITGARVLSQTAFSGRSVSVSQLESGVYFYKLLDGYQTIYSGKLIKK